VLSVLLAAYFSTIARLLPMIVCGFGWVRVGQTWGGIPNGVCVNAGDLLGHSRAGVSHPDDHALRGRTLWC
jgi:hypothetical protein